MESINENEKDRPSTSAEVLQGLGDAHSRIASRLHSPWWFHAVRGLLLAAMVFGLGTRDWWGQWTTVVALLALIPLARWRAGSAGFSRANPDRWAFLALGAPWSIVVLAAFAVAVVLVLLDRSVTQPQVIGLAVIVGLLSALLLPLADRAGRARMGHPSAGLPRS